MVFMAVKSFMSGWITYCFNNHTYSLSHVVTQDIPYHLNSDRNNCLSQKKYCIQEEQKGLVTTLVTLP